MLNRNGLLLALFGAVLGAGAAFVYLQNPIAATEPRVRDLIVSETMTAEVADQHRADQYSALQSIGDVVALPTDFMRREATFAIAGRSDSSRLQFLVFDADRIVDDELRFTVLDILFRALADKEPATAVALAQSPDFVSDRRLAETVWRAWSARDFDGALQAARLETSIRRAAAARGLYLANGIAGNERTERIEAELGVAPDTDLQRRYLHSLVDTGPALTIDFVNGLVGSFGRHRAIDWLVAYLEPAQFPVWLSAAEDLTDMRDATQLRQALGSRAARLDPMATLERAIAAGSDYPAFYEIDAALEILVAEDPQAAMAFLERSRSSGNMLQIKSVFIQHFANHDPMAALAWARENEGAYSGRLSLVGDVLTQIAESNPQLAFSEAMKVPEVAGSEHVLYRIISTVSRADPIAAKALLDQLPDGDDRKLAETALVSSWIRQDPDAAIDWIVTSDRPQRMLQSAMMAILRQDIQAAMRNLSKIPTASQSAWRQGIAKELATRGLTTEAERFVRQFEGQAGHDDLRASVAVGFSENNPDFARSIAEQMAPGGPRDKILGQLLKYDSGMTGQQLDARLNEISSETMRSTRASRFASQWYRDDPAAARQWVDRQPEGPVRDGAIIGMVQGSDDYNEDLKALVDGIKDPTSRAEAKVSLILKMSWTDPIEAGKLLLDDDIPVSVRERLMRRLNR